MRFKEDTIRKTDDGYCLDTMTLEEAEDELQRMR